MKYKLLSIFMLIIMCASFAFGCKKDEEKSENYAITINSVTISTSEAKFYGYNKQANYEIYYLASGSPIHWDEVYDAEVSDMTLEELVKKEVLDEIKKVVILSEYAKDEGIKLSEEDDELIEYSVNNYVSNSNKNLTDKTGKNKELLKTIYTRKMYIDKLYEKLEIADDSEKQEDLYNELLNDSMVDVNDEFWDTIEFNECIFTEKDVEAYSE